MVYYGAYEKEQLTWPWRAEGDIKEGSLLNRDFFKWADSSWPDQEERSFKAQGNHVQRKRGLKNLTLSVTKVRSLKSQASTRLQARIFSHYQVSLHSSGCDFCTTKVYIMSAVEIDSIFIIKSIMLPLKPGHVSVEIPSYIKDPWTVIGKQIHHPWKPL